MPATTDHDNARALILAQLASEQITYEQWEMLNSAIMADQIKQDGFMQTILNTDPDGTLRRV